MIKFKDMTEKELIKEKKIGKLYAYLGIIAVIAFTSLWVITGNIFKVYATDILAIDTLYLIVALSGIIQLIIIDFELRFRALEGKKE